MRITNLANLSENELAKLKREIGDQKTLGQVLNWANARPKEDFAPGIVAEVVAQDEYAHDVVIPYKGFYLVYDTT